MKFLKYPAKTAKMALKCDKMNLEIPIRKQRVNFNETATLSLHPLQYVLHISFTDTINSNSFKSSAKYNKKIKWIKFCLRKTFIKSKKSQY